MQVCIRNYAESDREALREIFCRIQKEEFPWTDGAALSPEAFDRSTEGESILTAEADGRIAGFLSLWVPDRFLHSLFIAKPFRGLGLGKALIEKAAERWGIPLSLKCVRENKSAAAFYLANGWAIEEEAMGPEGPYFRMVFPAQSSSRRREENK